MQEYNSWLHSLKGLYVKVGPRCFYYNFEPFSLRSTGTIQVAIENDGVNLRGYTDIVRKTGTEIHHFVSINSASPCQ